MKERYLFDLATGLFTGRSIASSSPQDEGFFAANTPPGFGLAAGPLDPLSQRVDLQVLAQIASLRPDEREDALALGLLRERLLIGYTPPSPGPDYEWSPARKRWVLTAEAVQRQARHAAAMSEIRHLEANVQPRIVRELQAARLDGVAPDADTVLRFRQLQQRIVELRAALDPNVSVARIETAGPDERLR